MSRLVVTQVDHNFLSKVQEIVWKRSHFSLEIISLELDSIVIRNPNVQLALSAEVVKELEEKISFEFSSSKFKFIFNNTNELTVKIL